LNTISKFLSQNANLETFDSEVFVGDDTVSQDVCNFILALSLFYNDYKDANTGYTLLMDQRPQGKYEYTPSWGEYNGLKAHFERFHFALMYELFELVEKNKQLIPLPFFQSIFKQLDKRARTAWQSLVDVSMGKNISKENEKMLLLVRNKLSFHYDAKEIFRGYKQHFLQNDDVNRRPFISRGRTMPRSRFYFSDAAAQSYFSSKLDAQEIDEFFSKAYSLWDDINFAIWQVVERFIEKRSSWRSYKEESA